MDFKNEIAQKISALTNMEMNRVIELMEVPPQHNMGDYAFPCFQLAKTMRKAPNMIAAELASKVQPDNIVEKAEQAGGYLNFFINKSEYIKQTVESVLEQNEKFGQSDIGKGKKIVVEYSSPNIAKPFHIGHMVNTATGGALAKIYAHMGYEVIRINHLGDWGTQYGKLVSAYNRWVNLEALEEAPIKELTRIYVKFHEEAEKDPSMEDEARANFKKLEDGDPEIVALWKKFRDLSLREFKKLYDELQVGFDSYAGESFYSDKMAEVVEILKSKDLLTDSNGAKIVELDQFNLPPCIIIKSDGATIYATRDLAAAIYRKRTYDFDKMLYVVGNTQALHFQQFFNVLGLMGFEWYKDCTHVGTSFVKFPDRKMATRSGDVVLAEDVMNEAINKTLEIMEGKGHMPDNMQEVAHKVGLGALVYTFLKNNRDRDIIFTWEDVLSFDGDSGPYVQYTYVRGKSILRKAGELPVSADYGTLQTDDEFNLVKLMGAFKDIVAEAADRNEPFVITRYVTEIAKSYNKFYNTHPILNAEEQVKNARLHLTQAVCNVIKTGLGLVGIETPENM